jgi:ATP-dependent DNA ligase
LASSISAFRASIRRAASPAVRFGSAHGLKPNQETTRHGDQPKIKIDKGVQETKATWVEPNFFADIEYRDITSEGLLRQSSFKGLSRDDKS